MNKLKKYFLLLTLILFCGINANAKKYHPDYNYQDFVSSLEKITVEENGKYISVLPENWEQSEAGFIFYPGAEVKYKAYLPLMTKLAEEGIPCFLIRMPCDLAILAPSRADCVTKSDAFSSIKKWYIGGHSLGGVKASWYATKNIDDISGLILLASYSIYDVKSTNIPVISIYGTKDGVLRIDQYEKNKSMLPDDLIEMKLEGGNHAGFGVYGEQKHDNPAIISKDEQLSLTSKFIIQFINNN